MIQAAHSPKVEVDTDLLKAIVSDAVRSALSEINQNHKRPLTEIEAAELLGVKPQTLALWRTQSKGPDYFKSGSNVRYDHEAIQRYKELRRVCP